MSLVHSKLAKQALKTIKRAKTCTYFKILRMCRPVVNGHKTVILPYYCCKNVVLKRRSRYIILISSVKMLCSFQMSSAVQPYFYYYYLFEYMYLLLFQN